MLGSRINLLRESQNLTQVQLAKKLGVTKQTISNWENENVAPSIDALISIANYFRCSTDYLLGLDELRSVNVTGLTPEQISHIQLIVSDLKRI